MTMPAVDPGTRGFVALARLFCVVPFLTGVVDVIGGVWIIEQAGAALPMEVSANAVLNNQIAFWGAIWFGFGVSLWWASRAPLRRAAATRILLWVLFLAGLARAYACVRWGYPGPVMVGAMAIELVLAPVLLVWLARLEGRRHG
jgi:hypothetical protein